MPDGRKSERNHDALEHTSCQSTPSAPLAQDDLAYEAEVSRSYLSQLEKGTFYASVKILEKLARASVTGRNGLILATPLAGSKMRDKRKSGASCFKGRADQ